MFSLLTQSLVDLRQADPIPYKIYEQDKLRLSIVDQFPFLCEYQVVHKPLSIVI